MAMSLNPTARIIVPTAGMSLLLLVLGGVAAWYLHRLQQDSSELLSVSVAKVEAAEELEVLSHEMRYHLWPHQAVGGSNMAPMIALRKEAQARLAAARQIADTPAEKVLLDKIERGYSRLFDQLGEIARAPQQDDWRQQSLDLVHDMAASEILVPARAFHRLTRQRMAEASQQNQALADRMGMGLLLLGACGAVAGLVAGYGIAQGIHRSLALLTIPVHDATGRLNEVVGPLTVSSTASFGELESALQSMADRVGAVVEQLQQSQFAASRAQQLAAMGRLAAGLAHELRNPLTSMKMLVQPSDEEPEGVHLDGRDLNILREEIDRLERTIQTFLDYARPPRLEKRVVVLPDVLRQTVDFVSRPARQLGITLQAELPDRLVEMEADVGQIRQVLLNLLLNAIDAAPTGTTVVVRLEYELADSVELSEDCGWIKISVIDDGPGLPAELADRIFEPFVSTKEAGTGLGLSICKRIVEEHDGKIWAANRAGGGAIVGFRLPIMTGGAHQTMATENEQCPPC
jgi:signal transduction histidine kinase